MSYRYLPMTEADKQAMLETIGVSSSEELFSDIPEDVRMKTALKLPEKMSEPDLLRYMEQLAAKNKNIQEMPSFLGAGVYDHYIPSIVDHVISRAEFYTAYTPYQPEISQGELQAIFEFQTMIAELTGMDVANSSMYDGGTALAEAAMLACGNTRRKKIIVSKAVHPETRSVIHTYANGQRLDVMEIDCTDGVTDLETLKAEIDENTAAVLVQYPNFFGQIERLNDIGTIAHEKNSMFIVSANPLALAILTPPGEMGADIVVGEMQPFGIPAQFGGPHCGYFAVKQKFLRKMPGRLVGETTDKDGRRGFVLTLQTREQHIRREKATSNICSNQALNALAASVAMTALGKKGAREMALQNVQKAHYAKRKFMENGIRVVYQGPMFNEFVIETTQPVTAINKYLLEKGMIGGYDLGKVSETYSNQMLVAVTELRKKEEIDTFVQEVRDMNGE